MATQRRGIFDTRTLAAGKTVAVGEDADNVRIARDGNILVSFGGGEPGRMKGTHINPLRVRTERSSCWIDLAMRHRFALPASYWKSDR